MANSVDSYWAQLVCVTNEVVPPRKIAQSKYVIGRAKACDWCIEDDKRISAKHCYIERDGESEMWLYDSSTNGTVVNSRIKVCKGERHRLRHGDEIFIVYKGESPQMNFGFVFQERNELTREAAESSLAETEATFVDEAVPDEESTQPLIENSGEPTKQETITKIPTAVVPVSVVPKKEFILIEDSPVKRAAESKITTDSDESKHGVKVSGSDKKDEQSKDSMEETLLCVICRDIFHDCISLQPCMHSFCGACYSDWMECSNKCPSCRLVVQRINKNHLINNLVEAYLEKHPDKQRSADEIQAMKARNKITNDMLYPKGAARGRSNRNRGRRRVSATMPSPPSPSSLPSSPSSLLSQGSYASTVAIAIAVPGTFRAVPVVCRQCPTGAPPPKKPRRNSRQTSTSNDPAQPSTSTSDAAGGATASPTAPSPTYVCCTNQSHVLCMCCGEPMPDRRDEHRVNATVPPMSCQMCYQNFCHAYWGCRKADCLGCLAMFKDLKFGRKCLPGLIMENPYESGIFSDYLDSINITVDELLEACLYKMEAGEYNCPYVGMRRLSRDAWLCYKCGLQQFRDLAYQYRRQIHQDHLPASVTSRPDCHWGKNCRTQRNKPHHAQRFNHVCEQTRTA